MIFQISPKLSVAGDLPQADLSANCSTNEALQQQSFYHQIFTEAIGSRSTSQEQQSMSCVQFVGGLPSTERRSYLY